MASVRRQPRSLGVASLAGIGVGLAALGGYVASGLLLANWSVDDFLAHLGPEVVGALLLAGAATVACFAVPVAAYLHLRLVSPLVVLGTVVVGWLALAAATGLLTSRAVFGLAVYAAYLIPGYLLLYALAGGVEYAVHR
jgi:hypothetical protein